MSRAPWTPSYLVPVVFNLKLVIFDRDRDKKQSSSAGVEYRAKGDVDTNLSVSLSR
jgi:hypothetical protein